jgi:hypothetical protein
MNAAIRADASTLDKGVTVHSVRHGWRGSVDGQSLTGSGRGCSDCHGALTPLVGTAATKQARTTIEVRLQL